MSKSYLQRPGGELNKEITAADDTISGIFDFGENPGITDEQRDEIALRIYGIGLDEIGKYAAHSVKELIKLQAARLMATMAEHDIDDVNDVPPELQATHEDINTLMGYQFMDGITIGMMLMLTRIAEGYDLKPHLDALAEAQS